MSSKAIDPEIQFMMDRNGVSSDVANAELDVVTRVNSARPEIEKAAGNAFAGLWFDPDHGYAAHVTVSSQASQVAVQNALEFAGLAKDVSVSGVSRSLQTLEQVAATLSAGRDSSARQHVSVGIDEPNNAIVLTATPTGASASAALQRAAADAGVSVTTAQAASLETTSVACNTTGFLACDTPFHGGTTIRGIEDPAYGNRQARCTAGFYVASKVNSAPYVLTAGHCNGEESGFTGHNPGWTLDGFLSTGAVRNYANQFWNTVQNADGDSGIIPMSSLNWPAPHPLIVVLNRNNMATQDLGYYISNDADPSVGTPVCFTGANDYPGTVHAHGYTGCGNVAQINNTEHSAPNGLPMTLFTVSNICGSQQGQASAGVQPGDSGGPVFSGHTAYGIVTAKRLTDGCFGYFTRISAAETAMNVNVVHGTS